jgi:hypothetical protein
VKRYSLLIIFLMLYASLATSTRAQTTVATFDNPLCAGNGVGAYGGIDFSVSPWDCEKNNLTGQTGTSISWYQQTTTGRFKFPLAQVLGSLSAATSSGSGIRTITTDAGESFSHAINTVFQTLNTGFSKPASLITVQYPGGWTIQLDNITYQTPSSPGPVASGNLGVSGSLSWDDGTPVTGSVTLLQILGPSSQRTLGTFLVSSAGALNGLITIDLTQPNPLTFQILLLGSSSAAIGSTTFQVIKAMFPAAATVINAKIVLWKATSTIKTFDLGLTP